MYLTETNTWEVVKKQFIYKLNAYAGAFTSLIFAQLLAFVFSYAGDSTYGTGSGNISITVKSFSGNVIILFTFIWAFVTGISITSKQNRDGDFIFVTNRLTSNLSNIAFLLTANIFAGVTAMLASSLLKMVTYLLTDAEFIINFSHTLGPLELIIGILATTLYACLFSSVGYIIGTLVQLNKLFIVIIPSLFFGFLFLEAKLQGSGLLGTLFRFFSKETSLLLFIVKGCLTLFLLFSLANILSNRMEVRR